MWIAFKTNPAEEALEAGLLPGDGIAVAVVVPKPDFSGADEREQRMELISMDRRRFHARDRSSVMHACRWDQATSYEKRHEC